MFRLWCKLFDDSNHLLKDMVVENDDAATNRTRKIFDGIHSACYAFGWIPMLRSLNVIPKSVSIRIILLTALTFLIWKFR